jgi:hypothetical protein
MTAERSQRGAGGLSAGEPAHCGTTVDPAHGRGASPPLASHNRDLRECQWRGIRTSIKATGAEAPRTGNPHVLGGLSTELSHQDAMAAELRMEQSLR